MKNIERIEKNRESLIVNLPYNQDRQNVLKHLFNIERQYKLIIWTLLNSQVSVEQLEILQNLVEDEKLEIMTIQEV